MLTPKAFSNYVDTLMADVYPTLDALATGHPKEDYMPDMGPRYGLLDGKGPMSVFKNEGYALAVIAEALGDDTPTIECYTGTGLAAVCLALGNPRSQVFTCDNYSEGEIGERGWETVNKLVQKAGLPNLHIIRGSYPELKGALQGQQAGLAFLDGPNEHKFQLRNQMYQEGVLGPHSTVMFHDVKGLISQLQWGIYIHGGAYITVDSPSMQTHLGLRGSLAPFFVLREAAIIDMRALPLVP